MKMKKPEIICMCGSTRFADLMAAISWEFEKRSKIVLRVNYVPVWYVENAGWTKHSHGAEQEGLKETLDTLHCRKIDLCDKVYVCDYNGYIGESTRKEIEYALFVGKPVMYFSKGESEIADVAIKLAEWAKDYHTRKA